jgi:hypothetical protein
MKFMRVEVFLEPAYPSNTRCHVESPLVCLLDPCYPRLQAAGTKLDRICGCPVGCFTSPIGHSPPRVL